MRTLGFLLVSLLSVPVATAAAVRVHPDGVNVNSQGATTVFLTFGGLQGQVPAEAVWCGELIPATPDIGLKCDPSTIFGSLPSRFNQSRLSGTGGFTDIMSIPPSVARRAYQAAADGQRSSFFYVRRFVRPGGGPDEYVAVTCRMAGGGARVPLALLDVQLRFATDVPVLHVQQDVPPPPLQAEITYNGTGRLKGRWEVVLPGDELPTPEDLLTEATLPLERRGLQRRYTELERFNIFLPPTGRVVLPGPDVQRLPATLGGTHLVLLRVEASDDKEADSNLASAGAGQGIVHSGAVAGFPLPVLRYIVGSADSNGPPSGGGLELLLPREGAPASVTGVVDFAWTAVRQAGFYRLDIHDTTGNLLHSAYLQPGIETYRAPSWLQEKAPAGVRWRVVALDLRGRDVMMSPWRTSLLPQQVPGPVTRARE